MDIGGNIRKKRNEINISQKELAAMVNVKQSMICQIERGTKVPTLPLSADIAKALHCEIQEFMEVR